MEIKGRLVKVLPVQTGQGRNGEWKKQEFVIELEGTYPRKVCISAWGDKVNAGSLVEGTMLNVFFDVESREFNGKWYTNLTAWKVEAAGENQQAPPPVSPMDAYQPYTDMPPMKDDLPF
ncbi:MAG: DUF3127 domain-containing protein [Bacteroidales bacterium]|jgi:hypothetical protein|nr:DUF3127 domain-containing protein [Bacteroidales bacterium]